MSQASKNLDEAIREARQERSGNEAQPSQLSATKLGRQSVEWLYHKVGRPCGAPKTDGTITIQEGLVTCGLCLNPVESHLTAIWHVPDDLQLESPYSVEVDDSNLFADDEFGYCPKDIMWYRRNSLFGSEKEAINAARKLRITERERIDREIDALDRRYDELEDIDMRAEGLIK